MSPFPTLVRGASPNGEDRYFLGNPLVDRYLEFVAGRVRANTLRAVAFDLKAFFTVVDKIPTDVVAADIFDFLAHQRGDRRVVRLIDGESGLAARTIRWPSAARQTPALDVLVDERDGLVDRLGQRIVMASAVWTMARGTQSLAEEELQHRAGTQGRLFAS
jgi:hypothetical protein